MSDGKRRVPQCVTRLAKLSSLSGLPTVHAEQETLQDISRVLSSFGAAPDFIAPNSDTSAYILLFNKHVYVVQMQRKWELGSASDTVAQHTVPVVVYKESVENIVSFVTSTIDDDFVFLVHKDERDATKPRSLADVDLRWLRFQASDHVEEFIGHCLSVCAPALLSKARMLIFQSSGGGSGSLSQSEIAAETERLVAEAERTLVVTDLVVRSVSDILTKVKFEVEQAVKKSANFTARWGNKINDAPSLAAARGNKAGGGDDGGADSAPYGVRGCEFDFQHVSSGRAEICARMVKAGEKKVLFSSEVALTDHTHEMAIVSDTSLRIEKARKDKEVYVIPLSAIEELVVEHVVPDSSSSSSLATAAAASNGDQQQKESYNVLVKIDFSVCTSIRGDVSLRFHGSPQGLRMKNLFVSTLTSAFEAVTVQHLNITESTDVFWARRGTLESQLVRLMRAIRPDASSGAPPADAAARAANELATQMNARLALYLCVKQPHRLVYSLSAASAGVDKRLLAFLARSMHRVFVAHHEAVANRQRQHAKHVKQQQQQDQKEGKSYANLAAASDDNAASDALFRRHGDLRCLGFITPCVEYEVNAYRFHRARVDNMIASSSQRMTEELSRNSHDISLLVPPHFGSTDGFASLALREYVGTAGARFVSLCTASPMERFSSDPQTLQSMGLQNKQFWASQFLKQLRDIVLDDGIEEVIPDSFKVVLSLIWRSFEKERQKSGGVGGRGGNGSASAATSSTAAAMNMGASDDDPPAGGTRSRSGTRPPQGGGGGNGQQQQFHQAPLDETTVIGGFLFSQFLKPSLNDPLGQGLLSSDLSPVQKKNLEDITCLIQCVLTQSDLPLAGRGVFSEAERRFLRRFIDNEVADANRVLRTLVYPDVSREDPDGDDGSMVPDFFPPPVPGEFAFGSVTLLPHGDPRTVESFWQRYILKMPIDLHNMKLLSAFGSALRAISLQALTASFVPSLHAVGSLGNGAVGIGQYAGVLAGSAPNPGQPGMMMPSESFPAANLEMSVSMVNRASSPAAPSAVSLQHFNSSSSNNNLFGAGGSTSSPSNGGDGNVSPRGGGRMRSQTLVRAENSAYERFAAAEMTIHRLTYEVKQLREQLQKARESELETRMAAARAMEQFSHSFAVASNNNNNQRKGSNSSNNRKNSSFGNNKKNRVKSPRRRPTNATSTSDSSSSSDSDDSDEDDDNNDVVNLSLGKRRNPLLSSAESAAVAAILSPEARWRRSTEQMPVASRSTRGAGSETVFGCPMDAQVLSFLAMPRNVRDDAAREHFMRRQSSGYDDVAPGAAAGFGGSMVNSNPLISRRSPTQGVAAAASSSSGQPSREDLSAFSNFSFAKGDFQLDPGARR